MIIHPQYDRDTLVNDIALIKLKRNVVTEQGSTAAPVCVRPVSTNIDDNFPVDNTAFAAGWGYIEEEGMATQIIAKEVALPLVEDAVCEAEYKDKAGQWGWLTGGDTGEVVHNIGTSTATCAGYSNGINPNNDENADACQGDSGGPLVRLDEDAGYELVGLTSWGYGCARTYGVFTQVGSFADWIHESRSKLDDCSNHSDCVDQAQIDLDRETPEIVCENRLLTADEINAGCGCKKPWKPMVCPDDGDDGNEEDCLTQADIDNGCVCKKGKPKCPPPPSECELNLTEEDITNGCFCKKGNRNCPNEPRRGS